MPYEPASKRVAVSLSRSSEPGMMRRNSRSTCSGSRRPESRPPSTSVGVHGSAAPPLPPPEVLGEESRRKAVFPLFGAVVARGLAQHMAQGIVSAPLGVREIVTKKTQSQVAMRARAKDARTAKMARKKEALAPFVVD